METESKFVNQDTISAQTNDDGWLMRNRKVILALMATSVLATTGIGILNASQNDFIQGPTQAVQVTTQQHGLQNHYEIQIASGKNGAAVDMPGDSIISSVAKAVVGAPLFSGKMCSVSFNLAANGTGAVSDFNAKGYDFEYNAFGGLQLKQENPSVCDTSALMSKAGGIGSFIGYITEARQDIAALENLSNQLTPAEMKIFQTEAAKLDSSSLRFPGQSMGIRHEQISSSAALNKLRDKLGEDHFDSGLAALVRQGSLEQAREKHDDMMQTIAKSASTYGAGDSRSLREQLSRWQIISPLTAQAQSRVEQAANFTRDILPYVVFLAAPVLLTAGLMAARNTENKKQGAQLKL